MQCTNSVRIPYAGFSRRRSHIGRGNEKVWICVQYTCGATRAVYLELVTGLSAQTFILYCRFVACGLPQRMVSDNAKTFKSAKKIIEKILGDPTVRKFFINLQLNLSFNLEKAPWQGEFLECLVQSV